MVGESTTSQPVNARSTCSTSLYPVVPRCGERAAGADDQELPYW
jgi:hypothetical protein